MTYDQAGRPVKAKVESTVGHAVEEVTTGYSATTGRPTTVSTASGALTTTYDNVGRVTSYVDANGFATATSYDRLNRPVEVSEHGGFSTRSFSYDSNGLLIELEDLDAGTFTAAYDLDGRIVEKGYPNGLEAETTYDAAGAPVRLAHTKTSNCSSNCTWIDERVAESVHGQWRTHSWELSSQEYSYDGAGRLTGVEDDVHMPAAVEGCTIRSYSFDQNSNRTALNTKAPASNGDCQQGAAGAQKSYAYDTADRLLGAGLAYDRFGRMTSIPAAHSGGGVLSYTYYANDQVRTISQDGVSKTYTLDRQINALVQIWQHGGRSSNRLPEWAVWAADPFPGDTRTVQELVKERPERSFVLYMVDPRPREFLAAQRCITKAQDRERRRD